MDQSATTISEEKLIVKNPRKKLPSFSRPPVSSEVFTEENKKVFDSRPGYARHFINQYLKTGDLKLSAKQAGLPTAGLRAYRALEVKETLNQAGLSLEDIVADLKDCVKAECLFRDKHGNAHTGVDLRVKIKAIELVYKLHKAFEDKKEEKTPIDLFQDVDLKE